MALSPGSWWVNRRTGQRMAVATDPGLRCQTSFDGSRTMTGRPRRVRHGLGRNPDRTPCFLEGRNLYLAWLTEDELHGGWKQLRLKADDGHIPDWLRSPRMNDFTYTPPDETPYGVVETLWVSVLGIRSGWLWLSGMMQTEMTQVHYEREGANGEKIRSSGHFNWALQAYNTFFLPASKAVPRLAPKYDKIRTTVYDHITQGGAIE